MLELGRHVAMTAAANAGGLFASSNASSAVGAATAAAAAAAASHLALPSLRAAIALGRGGAIVATEESAATTHSADAKVASAEAALVNSTDVSLHLLPAALQVSRGGAGPASSSGNKNKKAASKTPQEKVFGIVPSTPTGASVFYMSMAMALHYFGYSLARPVTVALFTSASTGYAGFSSAFPFAMAFVSPAALLLLMGYGSLLTKCGPQGALTWSTVVCSVVVSLSAILISACGSAQLKIAGIPAVKFITGPLFVFRESYVQLLTSQYWSFMASVLNPNESARWFGPIAGLTSIASAVAGVSVAPLVEKVGLAGSLLGTGFMLLLSLVGTHLAYGIANRHGFAPKDVPKKKPFGRPPPNRGNSKAVSASSTGGGESMWTKATQLFKRVPVLKALFLEILASQGLATVLNVCFVAALGEAIPEDTKRAGWVGVFFSVINIITMVLQFLILPPLMTVIEPRALWRALPLVTLGFTVFQSSQKSPSLNLVSASLLVMKVSEYSARRLLDEMVFVPLDFESRFVGKEVIGVFGYRFGKSLMSLGLSGLTQLAGEFGLQQLSVLSTVVALAWMRTAWTLSNLVPTHEEAQDVYNKEHKIRPAKKPAPPRPAAKKPAPRPPAPKKPAPRPAAKKK
jgi:TLC ATP/ADP transporter